MEVPGLEIADLAVVLGERQHGSTAAADSVADDAAIDDEVVFP